LCVSYRADHPGIWVIPATGLDLSGQRAALI
jgi:hypothetical protein